MKATPPAKTKLKRRWLQFSLRRMLVAVTVAGIWLGLLVNAANQQRRAVEALRADDIGVAYDFEWDVEQGVKEHAQPSGPNWLRDLLGIDFFADVVMVGEIGLGSIKDSHVRHLESFPRLRYLNLYSTDVGDEGLRHVAGLTELQDLFASDTPITDGGLKYIANLTKLGWVTLGETAVTDDGLEHLAGLMNLRELSLYGTKVRGEGLRHLAGLTKLRKLNLGKTAIGDRALPHLARLAALEWVFLRDTKVTRDGVEALQEQSPGLKIDGVPPEWFSGQRHSVSPAKSVQ